MFCVKPELRYLQDFERICLQTICQLWLEIWVSFLHLIKVNPQHVHEFLSNNERWDSNPGLADRWPNLLPLMVFTNGIKTILEKIRK